MDFQDLLASKFLHPATIEILDRVIQVTGKSFAVIEDSSLMVPAKVKIARSFMPHHIIILKQYENDLLNHYIPHECGHILRYYKVTTNKRKTVQSTNQSIQNAINDLEKESFDEIKKIPITKRYQILPIWIDCLISQVTSLPMDIFIEKWLYDDYPGLRNVQMDSLQVTYQNAIKTLNPDTFTHFPTSVVMKTNAMNYAFYKILDFFLGSSFFPTFACSSYQELGEKLFHCIMLKDVGLEGDINLANQWSELLGVSDWYSWGDFEEVTDGYGNS